MNIIQELDAIVSRQLSEQKLRRDSIEFKQKEIEKYDNFSKAEQRRVKEIEKEIEEIGTQIIELLNIIKQLKKEDCVNV